MIVGSVTVLIRSVHNTCEDPHGTQMHNTCGSTAMGFNDRNSGMNAIVHSSLSVATAPRSGTGLSTGRPVGLVMRAVGSDPSIGWI